MSTMRNSVMLIGIPTKPIMTNSYGKETASFKLAVRDDNDKQTIYNFDCVGYDGVVQRILRFVEQGRMVAIDGKLRCFDYEDNRGATHTHTEIVVTDLFNIDKKG